MWSRALRSESLVSIQTETWPCWPSGEPQNVCWPLRTGRIHTTLLSPPTVFAAKREGLSLLADVAAFGLNYQHDAVVTTQKFIRENRDTVGKYVKSQIDAVHFA